ncbi:hypothetical protein R1flu_005685 [Riccia fluitans]|uniref:Uncharacterized protein n=1 Tax=Riccia fluitans TaxID=41844 RepID=A0ABD1YUF7_9MARC
MESCGMLASMSATAAAYGSSSYPFVPRERLKDCRRICCSSSRALGSRFSNSFFPTIRNLNSTRSWNGYCQARAAAGKSNNGRRSSGSNSSSKNGSVKGSPDKKVDRKQRDNVWSSDNSERAAKASSKKDREPRRDAANVKSSNARAAESSGPATAAYRETKVAYEHDEGELEFLKYLSPPLPIESERVIHPEESFARPLWSTFCSSVSGVWRGVAAAFSPITAELEALYLSKENEYLYDARILNTVEAIRTGQDGQALPVDKTYLHRRVLWSLENPFGENGLGEPKVAEDADGENARLISFLAKGAPYAVAPQPADEDSGYWSDDENEDASLEYDAEWNSVIGTEEDIDTRWAEEKLDVMPELKMDMGSIPEDGKEWKDIWGRKEVLENDWERVASPVGEMAPPSIVIPEGTGPTYSPEHLTDALGTTWADVMEEDFMIQEDGLVYFEDGSYSRGPSELLAEASTSGLEYFNSYTCKIEQCLVAGGHKRLRVVHTVQIESEGEQVEVLRVAVYEEEWMGPCNMKSISDVGGHELQLYSRRPRHSPGELVGSWKVFEKEAFAYIPPKSSTEKPSFSHSSREISFSRGLPEMPEECPDYDPQDDNEPVDMTEFSMLWLTGGVSTYVDIDETGMLTFGIGWLTAPGSRLVIERTYGEDGKLMHVKSKTEIEASLGVPM